METKQKHLILCKIKEELNKLEVDDLLNNEDIKDAWVSINNLHEQVYKENTKIAKQTLDSLGVSFPALTGEK